MTPAKLVDARTAALLNQSELAALVGVRRQAILSYEQGVKSPEPETMAAIAKEQT
ncbi:MAG: helix-turn-helix transcriptional regulator [Rhodobacteraceae bacterium]|nr:helix-turn-helix transcriptional regulator [Paracoccaceae bacterium]MBT6544708.1 helix-turn-helix transcriptional regulator [Paracoccaceae bacterium]